MGKFVLKVLLSVFGSEYGSLLVISVSKGSFDGSYLVVVVFYNGGLLCMCFKIK